MSKKDEFFRKNMSHPGWAIDRAAGAAESKKTTEERQRRKATNGELMKTIKYALKKYQTSHAKKNGTSEFDFVRIAVDYKKDLVVSDEDLTFYIRSVKADEPR